MMAALTVRRAAIAFSAGSSRRGVQPEGQTSLKSSPGATDRESPNGLMLGPPGARQPDRQLLHAAAVKTTLVRFSLAAPPQA